MNAPAEYSNEGDPRAARRQSVAIIGMSCLFPSAPDLDAYWKNILGKVDAVTDPPPEAREAELYYDPESRDTDRVYCKRGGYLGSLSTFDPLRYGIPPVMVGGEPDQWLALRLAHDAMADAGCLKLPESVRKRAAVILGKGTYLNAGNGIAIQHGLVVSQTLELLKTLHPEYTDAELDAIRQELKSTLPPISPETVAGLIPNIIVGRIANRLDLMGPSYTVDAACASSLIAVQHAMRELVTRECDLVIVGGSQVWIPMPTLSIFCQLGALSRRHQIRPFDKDADGTLLGEGIGMLVLKRLEDAERDGDRIYAVVRGVGVASDGRGVTVMAPRVEGEALALRRAYDVAGITPRSVGLIEAHGTGTPVGDAAEVQALTQVFGEREGEFPRCAMGSVKSMISHTIPAAGVAGIIKVALALYHKVLPPTLNCDEVNPRLGLDNTPFYINTAARPWIHGGEEPRRAGVNAFGFGGINAHVVLEEHTPVPAPGALHAEPIGGQPAELRPRPARRPLEHCPEWDSEVVVLAAETPGMLLADVERLVRFLDSVTSDAPIEPGPRRDGLASVTLKDLAYTLNLDVVTSGNSSSHRLALVPSSLADLRDKLERAARKLAAPGCRQIKEAAGVYYSAEPLGREGKLAYLFPGEGSQYPNMLADLCLHFPEVRECFDRIDQVYHGHPRGYVPSDHIFPRSMPSGQANEAAEARLWQIVGAVEAVLTANQAMLTLMRRIGLRPDVIVGHSTGEFSAVRAAGIFDPENDELSDFILKLYRNYEEASRSGLTRAVLLAVGGGREQVEAVAREVGGDVYVAMDNCRHQAVLVGTPEAAERAKSILRREGLIFEPLNFDRAYHTPLFAPYAGHLRQIFEQSRIGPARTPIYSCTTAAPYPSDPAAIRELMVEHWLEPVEFRKTIETLYADGVRLFVEVGARGNLTAFVGDILQGGGRAFWAIPANIQRRSGITQLNHLVAILTSQGINLDLETLYRDRSPKRVDFERKSPHAPRMRPESVMRIHTGFPALRLSEEFCRSRRPAASPSRVDSAPSAGDDMPAQGATTGPLRDAPAAEAAKGGPTDGGQSMVDEFFQTIEQLLEPGGNTSTARNGRLSDRAPADLVPSDDLYPLLGTVVSWTLGEALVTRRLFDPKADPYLRDHTLGRDISVFDPDLLALPVMPFTMSMEILAEAAARLLPGRLVVGLREVRASRWIDFGDGPQELQVTARRIPRDGDRVHVELRNLTEDGLNGTPMAAPAVEAVVLLAESYAPAPPVPPEHRAVDPCTAPASDLYRESMFHGPLWQGVASVDRFDEDGATATLRILPLDELVTGAPNRRFAIDPVALDAAGQVIGFWTAERLATGKVIFPFRLEALDVHGGHRPPGERATCVASIRLQPGELVRSDIDVLSEGARPWLRLAGWHDKRFNVPEGFDPLMRADRGAISKPWPELVEHHGSARHLECRRVSANLGPNPDFWMRVWAHRVLGRVERDEFRRLKTPKGRRLEWLAGKTAAKEAVGQLLLAQFGLDVAPADVEVRPDGRGRPVAGGAWRKDVARAPVISIAHSGGLAAALACLPQSAPGQADETETRLGIDIEVLRAVADGFVELAFTEDERRLLATTPRDARDEWIMRFWCAKEAVMKALGVGPAGSPRSVAVVAADVDEGSVSVRLGSKLSAAYSDLEADALAVTTRRHDRLVVATTLCERADLEPAGAALSARSGPHQ